MAANHTPATSSCLGTATDGVSTHVSGKDIGYTKGPKRGSSTEPIRVKLPDRFDPNRHMGPLMEPVTAHHQRSQYQGGTPSTRQQYAPHHSVPSHGQHSRRNRGHRAAARSAPGGTEWAARPQKDPLPAAPPPAPGQGAGRSPSNQQATKTPEDAGTSFRPRRASSEAARRPQEDRTATAPAARGIHPTPGHKKGSRTADPHRPNKSNKPCIHYKHRPRGTAPGDRGPATAAGQRTGKTRQPPAPARHLGDARRQRSEGSPGTAHGERQQARGGHGVEQRRQMPGTAPLPLAYA